MLGIQHLDVPHLRGRTRLGTTIGEENETGGATEEKEAELTEEVGTSDRVGTSGNDGGVKKDRADQTLKAKQTKRQLKRRQHRDEGAEKGLMSRQADRRGRGMRVRREARRSRSEELVEQREPQVELEGEC